jgi:RHS repeat-associated protein
LDTVTFRDSAVRVTAFYHYDYDLRDRLIQRTDTIDGVARSIGYGYDIASNRTSLTTASGTTTYTYDERNRLDLVRLNGTLEADYDYDAVSNLTQTTFGNGTRENRSYDTLNRLSTLETKRLADSVQLSKYVYTLDKVGNRTAVTEAQNGQGRTIGYTYDDLYRLTGEAIVDATNGNRTSAYVYDKVGNRQTKTVNGVTTVYTYDPNDRLLNEKVGGVVTAAYTYDDNGSTLSKTENGVVTTYVWNDEKRLIQATVGGTVVDYRYNDAGIRVSSKQGGVETRYLLDQGMIASVWEEYAPSGTVQASYVYGRDLITQTQAAQTSYYSVDGLGSTRLLTDVQGQVLNSYGYEAFGETTSQSGTTGNKYQYAGEQFDSTLGDYYLRQRFYDTSSGRFGRMDTYEGNPTLPLTINKYTYGDLNPVNRTDPSGYWSIGEAALVFSLITILVQIGTQNPVSISTATTLELRFNRIEGLPSDGILPIDHALLVVVEANSKRTTYEAGAQVDQAQNPDINAKRGALIVKYPDGKPYKALDREDIGRKRTLPTRVPAEAIKAKIKETGTWVNNQRFAYNSVPWEGQFIINSNSYVSQALNDLGYPRNSILNSYEVDLTPGWYTDLRFEESYLPRANR